MTSFQFSLDVKITLFESEQLTGEGLAKVLPHISPIQSSFTIDLLGVVNTTSESIIGLTNVVTRLQDINRRRCTRVTDDSDAVLAHATPCLLRRVELSGLKLLTDDAISLALTCPMLLELDLDYCKLIADGFCSPGLDTTCSHCKLLFSHCSLPHSLPLLSHIFNWMLQSPLPTSMNDVLSPFVIKPDHL